MSDLTLTEQKHVRTALRYLHRRSGRWSLVGEALRFSPETCERTAAGRYAVTANMVLRVARLLGASVDDLLEGRFLAGACPKCGHVQDFADEATNVDEIRTGLRLV